MSVDFDAGRRRLISTHQSSVFAAAVSPKFHRPQDPGEVWSLTVVAPNRRVCVYFDLARRWSFPFAQRACQSRWPIGA